MRTLLGSTAALVVLGASAAAAAQAGGSADDPVELVPIIREYDAPVGRAAVSPASLPVLRLITNYEDAGASTAAACDGCTMLPAVAIGAEPDGAAPVRRLMLFTSYDGARVRGLEAIRLPRLAIVREYDTAAREPATPAVVVLPEIAIRLAPGVERPDRDLGRGAVVLPPVAVAGGARAAPDRGR